MFIYPLAETASYILLPCQARFHCFFRPGLPAPDLELDDGQTANRIEPSSALRFGHDVAKALYVLIETRQLRTIHKSSEVHIERRARQGVDPHRETPIKA
jgi:hypothetical protein